MPLNYIIWIFLRHAIKFRKNRKTLKGSDFLAIADVKAKFAKLTGLTSLDVTTNWIDVINEAISEIDSKLRSDVNKENVSARLDAAYAALSFYKYSLYEATKGAEVESFSAGDISIKCNKKALVDKAYKFWEETKISIYDLLEDENFLFKRTVDC